MGTKYFDWDWVEDASSLPADGKLRHFSIGIEVQGAIPMPKRRRDCGESIGIGVQGAIPMPKRRRDCGEGIGIEVQGAIPMPKRSPAAPGFAAGADPAKRKLRVDRMISLRFFCGEIVSHLHSGWFIFRTSSFLCRKMSFARNGVYPTRNKKRHRNPEGSRCLFRLEPGARSARRIRIFLNFPE